MESTPVPEAPKVKFAVVEPGLSPPIASTTDVDVTVEAPADATTPKVA